MKKVKTKIPTQKEIEESFNDWTSASPKAVARVKARNSTLRAEKEKKDVKFTARLSASDLEALRKAAEIEGMGYQTLLGSIIHKYVTGRLIDINEVKKFLDFSSKSITQKGKNRPSEI